MKEFNKVIGYEDVKIELERIIDTLETPIPLKIRSSNYTDYSILKIFSYPKTKEGYECSADNGEKICDNNYVCIDKGLSDTDNIFGYTDKNRKGKYKDPDCKTISSKKSYKVFTWKNQKIFLTKSNGAIHFGIFQIHTIKIHGVINILPALMVLKIQITLFQAHISQSLPRRMM